MRNADVRAAWRKRLDKGFAEVTLALLKNAENAVPPMRHVRLVEHRLSHKTLYGETL